MAIQTLQTLKSWFVRGAKPTQQHFADAFDSFVHKSDMIPQSKIEELSNTLEYIQETTESAIADAIEDVKVNGVSLQKENNSVNINIQQSDFAQNDSDALDYIKNRTHWKSSGLFREEIGRTTINFENNWNNPITDFDSITLLDGRYYTVKIDDNIYEHLQFTNNKIVVIANDFVLFTTGSGIKYQTYPNSSVAGIHTLVLYEDDVQRDVYYPLDERYIPETIARTSQLPIMEVDENCRIINVCRRLDLRAVGNKVEIPIPEGFTCYPVAEAGTLVLMITTYNADYGSGDNFSAKVQAKFYVNGVDSEQTSSEYSINQGYNGAISIAPPSIRSKITVEVTEAATGTSAHKYATIRGIIYCYKD